MDASFDCLRVSAPAMCRGALGCARWRPTRAARAEGGPRRNSPRPRSPALSRCFVHRICARLEPGYLPRPSPAAAFPAAPQPCSWHGRLGVDAALPDPRAALRARRNQSCPRPSPPTKLSPSPGAPSCVRRWGSCWSLQPQPRPALDSPRACPCPQSSHATSGTVSVGRKITQNYAAPLDVIPANDDEPRTHQEKVRSSFC